MNYEEKLEVFGDFDPSKYEEEVKERWGDSDAYRQSTKRTNKYTKEDWTAIKAEIAEIYATFVDLMHEGLPSDSPQATQLAERHRAHISRWFYDCSKQIHAGLGQMYVADIRFTKNIDKRGEGLAVYMSEAIAASSA
ncbi:MAG: TipAS antibiotic-recognition domain-containing protein [Acidimicrobiia bacterium]|nr:TipAS antibiotic-recognition domain-containing protein [Acidimicrobiia bacterium]